MVELRGCDARPFAHARPRVLTAVPAPGSVRMAWDEAEVGRLDLKVSAAAPPTPTAFAPQERDAMSEDPMAGSGASATAPSAVTPWRQRLAGVLLVTGTVLSIVALFLPWTYASWPSAECSSCVPETRAPADGFLNAFPPLGQVESWFFLAIWLAVLIGLPLALLVLGVRLLARRRAVRLRWKVLVILASIVAFCSTFLLAAVMAFHYIDSTAAVRTEVGEPAALLAPLAVLLAGMVMPTHRGARARTAAIVSPPLFRPWLDRAAGQ